MDDRQGPSASADDGGGYAVPPQVPAPPDAAPPLAPLPGSYGSPPPRKPPVPRAGPLLVPAEDPGASLWGPAAPAPADADRWGAAPAAGHGGTALLDRPTTRRPVVAPPVRPLPPPPPDQSWDWERSHGLRNALLAAALILLVGSLIAALVVFRNRDDGKQKFVEPPPATEPLTLEPVAPGAAGAGTVPSTAPVSVVPVPPPSTAAPATTAAPPPPTTAAPTTRRTTPTTQPRPTVTASPPYPGCPPCPTTTSRPITTTSSSTSTTNPNNR